MVRGAKDPEAAKMNCTLLVSFVEWFSTPELPVSFNTGSLYVKYLLPLVFADAKGPTTANIAELTERSRRRTSEQFMTGLAMNGGRVLRELGTERACSRSCVCRYLCSCTLKVTGAFCTSSSACSWMEMSLFGSWMEHCSSRLCWRLLPNGLREQGLFLPCNSVTTAYKSLIFVHSILVVNNFMKIKAVSVHVLPATFNMTVFPV